MKEIEIRDLGYLYLEGKRFVVNTRPGLPRNACVEEEGGQLRCWASRSPLTAEAESFVRDNASPTGHGTFVWNEGVRVREVRKG
jgi:hypothetical protein